MRLLGAALQLLGERPELQQRPARRARASSRTSSRRRCASRARSRATSASPRPPSDRRRRRHPRGHDRDGRSTAPRTATRGSSTAPTSSDVDRANARQHIAFGHGIHTCPGRAARAAEAACTRALLDRMTDIRISEASTARPAPAATSTCPTYILRGLTRLHLEWTTSSADQEDRDVIMSIVHTRLAPSTPTSGPSSRKRSRRPLTPSPATSARLVPQRRRPQHLSAGRDVRGPGRR